MIYSEVTMILVGSIAVAWWGGILTAVCCDMNGEGKYKRGNKF